jgi:hypothetical protein
VNQMEIFANELEKNRTQLCWNHAEEIEGVKLSTTFGIYKKGDGYVLLEDYDLRHLKYNLISNLCEEKSVEFDKYMLIDCKSQFTCLMCK